MTSPAGRIVVVGAGMVGVCCAMWLKRSGHDVVLIDRLEPGNGATYGNACAFATYACVPINSPRIPLQVPGLLFKRDTPLWIDWSEILSMTPWLLRFLANCRAGKVARIAANLGTLLSHAEAGAAPIFKGCDVEPLLSRKGCLYLYGTEKDFEAAKAEIRTRKQQGVKFDLLDRSGALRLEPNLSADFFAGLHFTEAFQYLDPRAVAQKIAAGFVAAGGQIRKANVKRIRQMNDRSLRLETDGEPVFCEQVVISAGAWSRDLLDGLTEDLPLGTERGYHVNFKGQQSLLNRPVGWASGGFYMTPMSEGLRVAGTVELGGLSERKNLAALNYLARSARRVLSSLPEQPDDTWLGFRPSMPDALPMIGRSVRTPEVIFAFGHQHIGVTLAGITGKIVASIADGAPPPFDISPFSPQRFGA